ncbi:probable 1-acyl-sn-glycerol-3-phosphate acyltransferase 5 isoform X2 [Phalaenopsis equestris]|nr:probable 1-acyl-sn-glycerol-3-phosphate acyltransferase 5 isoform X2 [Phalaenopsis equestris]XP_020582961.1 probable 1-acyl-sn-glycerol-3-phosphate acyltransferase 5 isoform X2 [Phalaenopsis equestris]
MDPKHINADGLQRRHQLTAMRVVRGISCLMTLLTTACMTLIYCAPIFTLLLRLFSIHYSRKSVALLFGAWLSMWPFLFEKLNNTKVVFSGDRVPLKERALLFANHRTEVDWMYLWDLALRKGCLGSIKYVLKRSLMKLPVFGWGFQVLEFISVERKWEVDETLMQRKLSTFKDPRDSLWLAVFPEGTDYTEQKCIISQKYAAENSLPILENVLLPKTKGFYACLEALRESLDAVYDISIAYKHRSPTFLDNAFGVNPLEVHIHIRRFLPHEIPESEKDVASWLIERFRVKDQLLGDFASFGYFPDEGTEGELSSISCLVKVAAMLSLTCVFLYLTFFSAFWFKIYVLISAVYLSYITHFDIQPTPIFGCLKSLVCSKKD